MTPIEDYEEDLPWVEVESSNLRRIAWVQTAMEIGVLYVEFGEGRAYSYAEVDRKTYQEMLDADSVGRFFARQIKPNHKAERMFQ